MKYTKIIILTILFGTLSFVSCDKGFEDLNKNPNEATSIPSGLLIADQVRVAANSMYSTFWGGDMGACWAQQWAKVQYNDEARYIPRESVITGFVWKNFYESVCSDARTMRTLAEAEGNDNVQAVAMTIEAFGFLTLTDAFGNVPFSEALDANNLKPKYDSQEEVYTGVLALLDQAIAKFGSGDINGSSDIIYGGSALKWKKFASSLKFRALMRISSKKDVKAELQALVDAGNLFSSTSDNAAVNYLETQPNANPIYESIVYGTRNEWKINSAMTSALEENNDPRLSVYAQKNGGGEYRGKPAGIFDVPNDNYNYDNVSPLGEHFLSPTLPGYFLTYSELMFLRAEAAVKGYTNEDAKSAFEAGVAASFSDCGLSATDAATFVASLNFNPVAGDEASIKKIAIQNWIGLFGQGFEAWTEWRRTKYPVLSPALEATSTVTEIPSRYTYPAIEQSVNQENFDAAVSDMGGNTLTTKMWWLK